MSAPAKHTFVVLAYKQSKYLDDCLKSVTQQTAPGHVLIATSTPSAFINTVAQRYQVPVLVNSNGGGIGNDWNFGLSCANTPYVTLAHQDDIYLPGYRQAVLQAAEAKAGTRPLMLFNKTVLYKNDKEVSVAFKNIIRWLLTFPFHVKRCISAQAIKKSILLFSNSISCPGVTYVKTNLDNFKFNETEKYILDWRAWYTMSQMPGSFIYLPRPLHIHREHSESATSTTQLQTLQQEELNLLTEIWGSPFIPRLIVKMLVLAK